ncbi:MAG: tRNA (adenosine(37)-N6)-threonylcarbamoyltransferase complex ATPase subunit type 1 TsaE [Chlamydiales bacterium]|nr:tRNA (adenosine(37)-N6)-threonylcarbamoyltransferase complex ATPase subunit type 1 TsaE [Chlamydiales bacterium]
MKSSTPTSTSGLRRSASADATTALGVELGRSLAPGSTVALFGDLGAGKTTFIRGIVSGVLGEEVEIDSPTYTYLNIYQDKVYHFDLYRLRFAEEFLEMGFDEYLGKEIVCIEWSERIEMLLPKETIRITLEHEREGVRCLISEKFAS